MDSNRSILAAYLAANPSTLHVTSRENSRNNGSGGEKRNDCEDETYQSTVLTSGLGYDRLHPSTNNDVLSSSYKDATAQSLNDSIQASNTLESSSIRGRTSDDELNGARLRTADLLNQYFIRQGQIEQQEKILNAQRLTSSNGTSSLRLGGTVPNLLQNQHHLTSIIANSESGGTLLQKLLHLKQQAIQQDQALQQLQELRSSLALSSPIESSNMSSASPLHLTQLEQMLRMQQLDAFYKQSSRYFHSMMGNSGNFGTNSVGYSGATSQLLNIDAFAQAQILSGLRDLQSTSTNNVAIERTLQQNTTPLLSNNALAAFKSSNNSMPFLNRTDSSNKPHANINSATTVTNTPSHTTKNSEGKSMHRLGRAGKFPQKLHKLLNDLEEQGRTDVAAFLSHGRAFAIFNTVEFASDVMPRYFRMSRYSSFQRQLNLYDFQRITEGPDKGAYHVSFCILSCDCSQ
jgi:hypothetical protein